MQSTTSMRPHEVMVNDRSDVGMFYEALAPYGRWFEYRDYGWVWTPYDMDYGWRPYHNGHWAYSDCGWTWISEEPWGWATFHYGRWLFDDDYGWLWVPGTEWAPAWVAWRYDDQFIGWAPLPPGARWDGGLRYGDDDCDRDLPPHLWCFVDREHWIDANLTPRYVPVERNVTVFAATKVHLAYDMRGNRPFNGGIDVDDARRVSRMPVQRVRIEDAGAPGPASVGGGVMRVFRPALRPAPPQVVPHQPDFAAPPSAEMPARDVERRDRAAAEEARLKSFYDRRQQQLEQKHQQERVHPPAGVSPQELQKRHENEMKALQQERERERHVIEERARKGIAPAGKDKHGRKDKGGRSDH